MQKQLKNGNFYIGIALLMMVILFVSSSMTYQQQSQVSLIQKLLANEPLKAFFSQISFNYAGSEVSISAKGYVKFVEFFIEIFLNFNRDLPKIQKNISFHHRICFFTTVSANAS